MVPTGRFSSSSPRVMIGLFTPGVSHWSRSRPETYSTSSRLTRSNSAASDSVLLITHILAAGRVGLVSVVMRMNPQTGRVGVLQGCHVRLGGAGGAPPNEHPHTCHNLPSPPSPPRPSA